MTTWAIDPGPHTGIFNGEESLTLDYTDGFHANPHEHLYNWIYERVAPRDAVILESFEWRKDDAENRSYIDYSPGEFVGVVKLFCQTTGVQLIMQNASLAKSGFWGEDKKVKAVGLSWSSRHERDAIKHWLYYKTFTEGDNTWLMKLK